MTRRERASRSRASPASPFITVATLTLTPAVLGPTLPLITRAARLPAARIAEDSADHLTQVTGADDPDTALALRTAVLDIKRDELTRLRARSAIDDDILRDAETLLDAEALFLSPGD
ncbi:hypothetical protein EDD29_4940 [Actinocorallia herbida]|uniref:Uncharacterized protein n=1 Tax=Actinocorallia herbida TaxID=58109 RepID=A0A3N1D1F4_9ACTN|nr:hypothetical protein [Actinocorallia herbida]ROO87341.1 hypothetical protein EDD29_4940 [Actinocorallia herbida]